MNNYPSFYALYGRWTGGDWFYKIYVTKDSICGAVVAGQFSDAASANTQLVAPAGCLSLFMLPWANKAVQQRQMSEERYDQMDPESAEFLAADKRNFQFTGMLLKDVRFKTKRHWWTHTLPNTGTMEILPFQQKRSGS